MARENPPALHPTDKLLLRPLNAYGKSHNAEVSFLRRSEYISSGQGGARFESSTSKDLLRIRNDSKRKRRPNLNKDDPINILQNVVKGFDVAYPQDKTTSNDSSESIRGADITDADAKAWAKPKHPTKPEVHLLDSYPLLPDLEAIPGVGSYILTKFNTDPVPDVKGYDQRLDTAILRPQNAYEARMEDKMEAYEADFSLPHPTMEYDYEFYLANDREAVRGIKRKFDANNPDRDDPELYNYQDAEGTKAFMFNRVRAYETYQQAGDQNDAFGDAVALALHDPDMHSGGTAKRLKKGAYFYPILQRTYLRPKRQTKASQMPDETQVIDALQVTVRDADESELNRRLAAKAKLDTTITPPAPVESTQEVIAEA